MRISLTLSTLGFVSLVYTLQQQLTRVLFGMQSAWVSALIVGGFLVSVLGVLVCAGCIIRNLCLQAPKSKLQALLLIPIVLVLWTPTKLARIFYQQTQQTYGRGLPVKTTTKSIKIGLSAASWDLL